jgi:hypothetical protein
LDYKRVKVWRSSAMSRIAHWPFGTWKKVQPLAEAHAARRRRATISTRRLRIAAAVGPLSARRCFIAEQNTANRLLAAAETYVLFDAAGRWRSRSACTGSRRRNLSPCPPCEASRRDFRPPNYLLPPVTTPHTAPTRLFLVNLIYFLKKTSNNSRGVIGLAASRTFVDLKERTTDYLPLHTSALRTEPA